MALKLAVTTLVCVKLVMEIYTSGEKLFQEATGRLYAMGGYTRLLKSFYPQSFLKYHNTLRHVAVCSFKTSYLGTQDRNFINAKGSSISFGL